MKPEYTLADGLRHHQAGDLDQALVIYQSILDLDPHHADALHLLGVLAHQQGRHQEAVEFIGRAIQEHDGNAVYFANRALPLYALEAYDEALEMCERAIALDPASQAARLSYGAALQALGRHQDAVVCYQRLVELDPTAVLAHYNLGTACKDLGDLGAAVKAYERALSLDPGSVELRGNLAGVKLEQGAFKDGLALCDGCLEREPENRLALAYKGIALQALGDINPLRTLNDFERFLFQETIVPPAPWDSVSQLNTALAAHILKHPSLRHEPKLQATRFGRHTGELLVEPKGPIATLEELIKAAIGRFMRRVARYRDHPFIAHLPRQFRLTVWAVVMHKQGFQLPHIHADGYISGVYYAQLPEAAKRESDDQGWIEFGRPPAQFPCANPPWLKTLRPREGALILFPSYFYHRTIPFDSDEERISIAFDAVPA
ncbi:MAG: tetratricopeptide repeat protein [Gammaproteobacteria bacterium]|nr:tetratricopeptide repeat protein [Gammaproteobacteria bacterium]